MIIKFYPLVVWYLMISVTILDELGLRVHIIG